MPDTWNPGLYRGSHSFVYELAQGVVELAAVQAGERVLDVGCGTGQLTARLAELGADVLGIDVSPAMVEAARRAYPGLDFEVRNVLALEAKGEFDLVFSNATLHWVSPPEEAARRIGATLKPGGRFVAEFGGHGNIDAIRKAIERALAEAGRGGIEKPWYYPTVAEYTQILAGAGLRVTFAKLFPRPTPLEGSDGMRNWLEMFAAPYFTGLDPETAAAVLTRAEEIAAADLCSDGAWHADYVRLRLRAVKQLR
jgi:trans-aconitate methyltransferase